MLTPSPRPVGALILLAALSAAGCRSGTPTTAQVRGKVAYRGAPLRGGVIVFAPDSGRGTHGAMAHGEIQSDGTYVLHTGELPGAVPGWHRVTVVAVQAPPPLLPGERFAIPQSILPEKYRDPELCGLAREVKAGQTNVIDFDLD
jgi:hypothetical protein